MFYWSWRGAVGTVLALGVSVTVILLATGTYHATGDETTAISTVAGAIIGALATFLGGKGNGRNESNNR